MLDWIIKTYQTGLVTTLICIKLFVCLALPTPRFSGNKLKVVYQEKTMVQKGFANCSAPLFESLHHARINIKQKHLHNQNATSHHSWIVPGLKQEHAWEASGCSPRLSILWNCWVIAMVPAGSTVIITQIVSPKKFPVAWWWRREIAMMRVMIHHWWSHIIWIKQYDDFKRGLWCILKKWSDNADRLTVDILHLDS